MMARMFENCCRLCLDETKEQMEISAVEQLAESLLHLYALKIHSEDRCSKKICVDCYKEVNECQKWLKFHDEQKQLIHANQQRFEEELLEQLGPEPVAPAESRAARLTRRSALARAAVEDEEISPKKISPVKQEPVLTRSRRKIEWEPPSEAEQGSESASASATDAATDDEEEEEEEEDETSETGTTTTDAELKCPKCDVLFDDLQGLQSHICAFTCPICNATVKYKASVKRHLIQVHKVKASEWQNYFNQEDNNAQPEELLVENPKPRKRYRYESDSPTDLEEDSNTEEATGKQELSCNYCADKFETTQQMNAHDCDYGCNICGFKFAHRGCVKRHKIRVHKIDPNDPSVQAKPRSRTPSRRSASRPPSRPPSRAASENPSDDEPLAVLATPKSGEDDVTSAAALNKSSGGFKYTYLCTDCEYSHRKRYRVTCHMISVHGIPKEQIDLDAIPREYIGSAPKTPERPKTPTEKRHRHTPQLSTTPPPLPPKIPERTKTPDLIRSMDHQFQHRSRSRSTYQDDLAIGQKRKRSLSACSSKSARPARSRSIPPSDRPVLVAKRKISSAMEKVSSKLRPTLVGIESSRLHVEISRGCELLPQNQQFRIRASKYNPQEPCPTKRLFKLRNPVGNERLQVNRLREIFRNLSHRVDSHSKVNKIDVESLVLDPVPRNRNSPTELLALLEQDPFSRDFAGFEEETFNPVEEEVEVDTKAHVVPVLASEVVHVIEEDDNSTDVVQIVSTEEVQVIEDDDSSSEQTQEPTEKREKAAVDRGLQKEEDLKAKEEQSNEEPETRDLKNEEAGPSKSCKNSVPVEPNDEPVNGEETDQTQGPSKKPKLAEATETIDEVVPVEPTKQTEPINETEQTEPIEEPKVVEQLNPTERKDEVNPMEQVISSKETKLMKDTEPVEPMEAVEPTVEVNPADEPEPSDDVEFSEETDPMKDTEQAEPIDAVEPANEVEPAAEPESTDNAEETDPIKDTEPLEPTDAVQPTVEVNPTDEPEPTDDVVFSEETDPMKDTEPVELANEVELAAELESSDDEESSEEADPMKDTEPVDSMDATEEEPADETKPADDVESSEESEPMDETEETSDSAQTKDTDATEEPEPMEETNNADGAEQLEEVALLDEDFEISDCDEEGQDENLLITPD